MNEVQVHEMPDCDFCEAPAPYDDKTHQGPWGNMCEEHYKQHGVGIGSKRVLIQKVKVEPKAGIPTVTFKLTKRIMYDLDYPKVKCPHCGQSRTCEMDAHYEVTCESCGNGYRISSPV